MATTATIGRQVLTSGTVATRTACTSTMVASTCTTNPAASGAGSAGLSSPCACPFTGVAL
ncbi:MAG: hypothetical protein HXO48_04850 [Prevotella sp.]|nr:hypothetical protein [Prevotella sp.]